MDLMLLSDQYNILYTNVSRFKNGVYEKGQCQLDQFS